jgi:hypothetical protein
VAPAGQGVTTTGGVPEWFHLRLGGSGGTILPTQFTAAGTATGSAPGTTENQQLGIGDWAAQVSATVTGSTIKGLMWVSFSDGTGKCQSRRTYSYTATQVAGVYP